MMDAARPDKKPVQSIARLIGVLVVLTSAVVSVVAGVVQLDAERRAGLAEVDAQFELIRVSHVPALSDNVWALDQVQVESQLEGIRRLPGIVRAEVQGPLPWLNADTAAAAAAAASASDAADELTRVYELRHRDQGDPTFSRVGNLRVVASLEPLQQSLRQSALRILVVELLRATALSLVLLLGLRLLVSNRLQAITRSAAAISLDNLGQPLPAAGRTGSRRDDIDLLRDSIEGMRVSLRDQLTQRGELEAHSRDLEVQKHAAELANTTKSDFLAAMSHEIRTPMNAIIGMSNLALQSALAPGPRRYIEKVLGSSKLLLGVINDVLDYSKVEAGMLAIEHIDFELGTVLDGVIDMVGQRADEKRLELLVRLAPGLPAVVIGDPLRLRQILLNLCSNAVKFTDVGEVTIDVSEVTRDDTGVALRFAVEDTGIGIAPEQLPQLFQAFRQADGTITRRFGGTGLGLAISQRLAGLMGATISARRRDNGGSIFEFTLRLGLGTAAAVVVAGNESTSLGGKVLIVDDNSGARAVLRDLSERLGFQVDEADSGMQALAQVAAADAADAPYRIVLLDWRMPGMNGLECAQRIVQDVQHPPCVLMVTAFSRDELVGQLQEHQVQVGSILTKPVTPSGLLDACHEALGLGTLRTNLDDYQALVQFYRRKFEGLRLLLAEDNEVNIELAAELLERVGIAAVVARDGAEALELLQREKVDGVLMDCQMPVLDGLSAARRIRSQARWRSLPILAMTANASLTDRDEALAAGMNDHIAKPVDVETFYATLARWLVDARTPEAAAGTGTTVHALPPLPGIDLREGLSRVFGNEALFRRMLRLFAKHHDRFVAEFEAALSQPESRPALALLHTLRGAASTVAATEVAAAAGALEDLLRDGPPAEVPAARQRLQRALAQLRPALDQI